MVTINIRKIKWFIGSYVFIKLKALVLTEESSTTMRGEGALRGIGTLDFETVTSRSGGLRGWYHSLLLLFLSNMCPVHISLDLQGVGRIYDLL